MQSADAARHAARERGVRHGGAALAGARHRASARRPRPGRSRPMARAGIPGDSTDEELATKFAGCARRSLSEPAARRRAWVAPTACLAEASAGGGAPDSVADVRELTALLDTAGDETTTATPSVFHQRHIGRVLRSSCDSGGRRQTSSRGGKPRTGRCSPLWPGDLRNDGGSVSAAGADGSEA